jgi:hypothetical protein
VQCNMLPIPNTMHATTWWASAPGHHLCCEEYTLSSQGLEGLGFAHCTFGVSWRKPHAAGAGVRAAHGGGYAPLMVRHRAPPARDHFRQRAERSQRQDAVGTRATVQRTAGHERAHGLVMWHHKGLAAMVQASQQHRQGHNKLEQDEIIRGGCRRAYQM